MLDRVVVRLGAAAAMVGAVLGLVFNLLYPRADEAGEAQQIVNLAAEGGRWQITHYVLGWSIGLIFLGLIAIWASMAREPSRSWARVGVLLAVGGSLLIFTALTLLGFSVPNASDAGADAAALSTAYVAGGLFLGSIGLYFGLTPLAFGAAMLTGDDFPDWLGWLAVLAGAVGVLTGTIVFFGGFSSLTDNVLFPIASGVFTIWVGITGYFIWQRTSGAAPVGTT